MGNTQKKTEAEKTKWQNILRIYKRDFKNILHNPVALLITVGLLVLPSLYAWVNIVACWDPYGNTNGIKVAVVNMDQGVTLQGNTVNAGDEIVKNLRENDAIGWQFVSEEDAEYGLTHDRYYAMLEIPENFSSQLVNVLGDNYEKPQIIYRVNEKSNAIAPKITDTGAKTVTNEVTKAIIEVVDKVAFAVGNDVGEQIDTHEGKIKMLRDTVLAVNDNFGELEAELEKDGAGIAFFNQSVEQLGGLDLLVNNAGVTILESIFDLTEKNMDYLIQLLFRNYVILMREAATYMAKHGIRGNIINISSVRGESAHPGDLVYGGIKAALNRACQSVALDCAPYGIRVNNILPGATKRFTPEEEKTADPKHLEKVAFLSSRIPLERYGTPEDIGNAVVFLASEKASYITGISLVIDGGLSLPGMAETAWEAETGWGRMKKEL